MESIASRVYKPSDFSVGQIHEMLITLGRGGFSPEMAAEVANAKSGKADGVIGLFQLVVDVVSQITQLLSKKFGREIKVDPLPPEFTDENLARWARSNLKPVFLPDEEIGEDSELNDWTKPDKWLYSQIRNRKIAADSAKLFRGWYLADFTIGVDYTDGTQVFPDDPLSPIIARLREQGKIGKYDNTPAGSRFAITNEEWRNVVCPAIAEDLGFKLEQVRLERASEFNAIGNIYDPNRGKFNMWEWFSDIFEDSYRLCGGLRGFGGLSDVSRVWSDSRGGSIAGRPLVSFVS